MTKTSIEKIYTIILMFVVPIFIAYFFFCALSDKSPALAITNWFNIIQYPNIGTCGGDTIHFGDGAAVVNAGRTRSDLGCIYSVWFDPYDLLTLGIGDSAGHKEYTMKLLSEGTHLGRFDRTTYIFTSEGDTIFLELNVRSASDLMEYHYGMDVHFPGDRYDMGLFGTGIDVPMALDAIKKYAYRDEGRHITYDRALTEGFLH